MPVPLIFIRCVDRPDTNVYFTLANMACADPEGFATIDRIHLVSGDDKVGFMSTLSQMNRVVVHHRPLGDASQWKPKRRGAWSYSFFAHEAKATGRDCIVLEDDITFANGWLTRMMATIARMRSISAKPFVLSAYHRTKLASERGYEPLPKYVPADGSTHFWGNLCTFWCKELIPGFLPYFDSIIKAQDDMSTDLSVRAYCDIVGAPFFVTVPSLVQHMGDKTTLRPDGIRRGPMFESYYEGK